MVTLNNTPSCYRYGLEACCVETHVGTGDGVRLVVDLPGINSHCSGADDLSI